MLANTKDRELFNTLAKHVEELGAGEGHVTMPGVPKKRLTTVYSVYIDQRPSHEILDDLMDWAEANNDEELIEKVSELSEVRK